MHAGVFLTCGQKPERSEEEAPGSELRCCRPRTDGQTAMSEKRKGWRPIATVDLLKPCKDGGV